MLRLAPDAPLGAAIEPAPAPGRRRRGESAPAATIPNLLEIKAFPGWARLADAEAGGAAAAFSAGAGLALLDRLLRAGIDGLEPAFAGVLRPRLALTAAATCARLLRRREDEAALRDAEHFAPAGAPPTPAGRLHRLFRLGATRSLRLDAATLTRAAELLALPAEDATLAGLAAALQDIVARAPDPLAAAAGVSAAAMVVLAEAPPVEAEILALWFADLALAQKLGWDAPVPLLATAIAHPALRRRPSGRRPRPGDADWGAALAAAYARAAPEAYARAADLARRAEKLLAVQPKLRAKGAGRVVALLLADDCVAPARAAQAARLSDRAARRLFDRLMELAAVRELSGRPSFRLYGL